MIYFRSFLSSLLMITTAFVVIVSNNKNQQYQVEGKKNIIPSKPIKKIKFGASYADQYDENHADGPQQDQEDNSNSNHRRIPLDLSELGNINDADIIDMQLDDNGKHLTFVRKNKKEATNNNKTGKWYGESVTITSSNNGSDGEKDNHEYDIVIDSEEAIEDGGESTSSTFNIIQSDNNTIFASISTNEAIYQISPDSYGIPNLIRYDLSEFPDEGEPLDEIEEEEGKEYDEVMATTTTTTTITTTRPSLRGVSSIVEDTNNNSNDIISPDAPTIINGKTIIDVMVLWTYKAECKQSGLSKGCNKGTTTEKNIKGLINLAIEETNVAFEQSGVNIQLNLAHSYLYENYDEDKFSYSENLYELIGDKNVQNARKEYGADLVAMIIDHDDLCGIARMGPGIDSSFSVTTRKCATGYYSFGHELAHNMGCRHDRGTENRCSSNSGSNYAYRDEDATFRSILGYNCRTGQCDNIKGNSCPRVQRFSNTYQYYNGRKIGTDNANNAKQLEYIKDYVSSYYPSKTVQQAIVETSKPTTSKPTNLPTPEPTSNPTTKPTNLPTPEPTSSPTLSPTTEPTNLPTLEPTTIEPTVVISSLPSSIATTSQLPTVTLSDLPSTSPSLSSKPTITSSHMPTNIPTNMLSHKPSTIPTTTLSTVPSNMPTNDPTKHPTIPPTPIPTRQPTLRPTPKPTNRCLASGTWCFMSRTSCCTGCTGFTCR